MLLTHNEDGNPIALFVNGADKAESIQLVMDERMFSDTVIRVVQLSTKVFLACDIRVLNGSFIYEKMNYAERRQKLEHLLDAFHYPSMTALISYDEVPEDTPIRGWETYDDMPGTMGVFLSSV